MFRRRKGDPPTGEPDPAEDLADDPGPEQEESTAAAAPEPGIDRSEGPYDVGEVPEDDEVPRLDVGGLHIPLYDGMELRLDVDETSGAVTSATIVAAGSAVQLSAFAAPRVEGIWAEVRAEIAAGVSTAGGTVDEVIGPFGTELHSAVPAPPGTGAKALTPVRFVGIDGPRWFLRALFTDAAARGGPGAAPLEAVVRGCVVVRGSEPMAPGDALTLVVPSDVPPGLQRTGGPAGTAPGGAAPGGAAPGGSGQGAAPAGTAPDRRKLPPPRRGPEITEIR